MVWFTCSEKHCIPCLVVLKRISHTQKDREKENHADTDSSNPHQIRKNTAKRRFRSKKLFIVECKSLHDRKEKGKELCVASQLHRIRW